MNKSTVDTQTQEFHAAYAFATKIKALPAIVNDYYYPVARYNYESALNSLIAAMRANGRFAVPIPEEPQEKIDTPANYKFGLITHKSKPRLTVSSIYYDSDGNKCFEHEVIAKFDSSLQEEFITQLVNLLNKYSMELE
jgi:hypothetical protein